MHLPVNTAVLISGRGSNMVALVTAAQQDSFPAKISLVISNRPDAAGLDKARELGIDAICIDHKSFSSRRDFERALHKTLMDNNIDLICCAGFMRILTPWFVAQWPRRILNIHPSLLPKYKGLNTHQRALDAGDNHHGCTVHYVSEVLDGGEIILQNAIDIKRGDTAETLADRLLPIELQSYVRAFTIVANKLKKKHAQPTN